MNGSQLLPVVFIAVLWLAVAARYSRQAAWLLLLWIPIQGWIQLNVLNNSNAYALRAADAAGAIGRVAVDDGRRCPARRSVSPHMRSPLCARGTSIASHACSIIHRHVASTAPGFATSATRNYCDGTAPMCFTFSIMDTRS